MPLTIHQSAIIKLKQPLRVMALFATFFLAAFTTSAQNGTYQKKAAKGAYGIISVQTKGGHVTADIFTWWNTPSAQTGCYYGEGVLKGNIATLNSEENDPDCNVTLNVLKNTMKAQFNNCNIDHLTEDFNGLYTKITDAVTGEYVVTAPKSYFHKTPATESKMKTYVLKGDKVRLDIDRAGACRHNWVYVYFTNKAGKETSGFILLSDIKRIGD